jgi:quercetin 2,3-dioxygenase
MLMLRPANDRGHADFGWLDSRHTFSFGRYFDAAHMGFGPIRVINDDRVAGGGGFPSHPHDNMEIITYVLDGALRHEDSLGTGSVIRPGDVQRMSAGTGIVHSEFNASATDPVHFLQIWIVPEQRGLAPGYQQSSFGTDVSNGKLTLIGSRDGRDGSLTIHQDVALHAGRFATGTVAALDLRPGRQAWVQVARGELDVNGIRVSAGDGLAIADTKHVAITAASDDAEVLVFDVAA